MAKETTNPVTFQKGIKQFAAGASITQYALFLGGLDVTRDALAAYDPFKGGFGRIFMTRGPVFIEENPAMFEKLRVFKHILEYANTGISGINDVDVSSETISGGYVGREFAVPTIAKNSTNQFTISTYEFSGSPMRELLMYWVTGVMDLQSGFSTYHGATTPVKQSNHTAEFVYVLTDQTGRYDHIEFACLFANCFPTGIKMDHLNTRAGEHNIADMDISFTTTMYESPKINEIGKALLKKYQVLTDSLDFNPRFIVGGEKNEDFYGDDGATSYNSNTGLLNTANNNVTTLGSNAAMNK